MAQKDKLHGDKEHGEGNYAASRQYNEAAKKFAQSGKVERAAREAAPKTPAEADELRRAEDAGKSRAKEEDPELHESEEDIDDDAQGDIGSDKRH